MKKIMFNDKYGLTKAVLEGRKTMTRRTVPEKLVKAIEGGVPGFAVMESKYKVGEVVAMAQAYKDTCWTSPVLRLKNEPGWSNKMFVYAGLMPHQIRITNVRVERLQDISDEDALREGVIADTHTTFNSAGYETDMPYFWVNGIEYNFDSPREAFAALIDRLSGKGTFESNPWVFVYEFELVK